MATVKVEAFQSGPLTCSAGGDEIKNGEAWALLYMGQVNGFEEYRVVHFKASCMSVFNVGGTDSAVVLIGEVK